MTMAVMNDSGNNNSVVLRIHEDSSSSSEDERENATVNQKKHIPNGRSRLKAEQRRSNSIAEDDASERSGSSLERNGSYFFGGDHLLQASTQRNAAAGGAAGGAAPAGGDVDPPTKLIGNFLQRQKESGTFALDPTMDDVTFWAGSNRTTPDVSSQASPTISASQSWKNLPKPDTVLRSRRASFQDQQQNEDQQDSAAILKAPSRISSGKNYARASSKSRLVEPPGRPPISSELAKKSALLIRASQQQQQSSPQRSGMLGARNKAEIQDEDDPLDVPHRFSRSKWDFWAALQLAALVIMIAGLVCATNIPFLEHRKALGLDLWRWAVLALVVMSGRLLSGWIIHVLVFFIERNFLLRKRVLYFVYGLHKGVQNCLWFGIILLAWRLIFDPNLPQPIRRERKVLEIVTKVLVCLLVAASLWLLKILLVKVLALSFHVNTYFDRIQDSLFSQYILETLSGAPLLEQQALIEDEKKVVQEMAGMLKNNKVPTEGLGFSPTTEDRPNKAAQSGILRKSGMISTTTGKSGMITGGTAATTTKSQMLKKLGNNNEQQQQDENAISIEDLQRLNQRNVSAWNMKRLIRLVKHSRITTLAQSIEAGDLGDEDQEIQSEWQAKVGAKHIFNNVARLKCKYLTLSDFMRFLREEEAVKAFGLFDGALDSGMISKQSLINWVVNVYRERRALMFTLNDTKTAVNKLHKIIDVIMSVIIFVIWLLILEIASTHLLVLISSQLVLVAFVFGNTCKTVFEAIIFLFAMHPFDVGDRCVVDGVQMVVEEMNILTTVFLRYDNEKIYYPNTVLATKPISNFYRSPDMGDAIDFSIHIATPREKIEALKEKIAAYIDSHLHHWYVTHTVVMKEIEDMNRIRMAIWLQHTMNHQDCGEKWIRRSDLLFHLKDVFHELGIDYRMLPQEVHVRKI